MEKKKIIPKLKNKYRFIIYNDSSFAEIFSLRLSLLNTYVVLAGGFILFVIITFFVIYLTPLKQFVASDVYVAKSKLYKNTLKIDSLESIIIAQNLQYKRIQLILAGKDDSLFSVKDKKYPSNINLLEQKKELNYIKAKADSILRADFEDRNRFNVMQGKTTHKEQLSNLYLYPPLKNGIITKAFKETSNEDLGVDITAKAYSHIMATASGTIISINWSIENGYKIIIQHENNLVSCYKNTSDPLKKVGEKVKRGEAIAILKQKGIKTTEKPYLHFELWHEGIPLNPKDFVSF